MDEDVAVKVARCLQQAGHEVVFVADTLGKRTDDVEVWRYAARTGAIMVTCNRRISWNWPAPNPPPG